jgi:hypothetical protein
MYSDQNIQELQIFASKGKIVLQGLNPNNKRLVQAEVLSDYSKSSLEEAESIDFQIKTKDLLYALKKSGNKKSISLSYEKSKKMMVFTYVDIRT